MFPTSEGKAKKKSIQIVVMNLDSIKNSERLATFVFFYVSPLDVYFHHI